MDRRPFLAMFGLALTLVGPASASAQPVTYGMNLRVLSPEQAAKMVELGGSTVRVVFGWDVIEPACKGCYLWSVPDSWVEEARRNKLTIFGTLAYSPRWANGGHTYNYPPLNYQDWYDYVFAIVSRYKRDVSLWGLWNEPNLDVFWKDGDLRAYQMVALTARAAIRAADPTARTLGPEVSHHAIKDGWYMSAMRNFGDAFDIVTVHWYPDGPDLDFMMDQMVRPFAGGKPVWLTETGLQPCGVLGEAGQLTFYNKVLESFLARRAWWTGIFFYDLYNPPEPRETMTCGSGITRADYSNRPAFTLYQRVIRTFR